jgi:hypothetical protein
MLVMVTSAKAKPAQPATNWMTVMFKRQPHPNAVDPLNAHNSIPALKTISSLACHNSAPS